MNFKLRPFIFLAIFLYASFGVAQQFAVRKGAVTDSIAVNDTLSYALFLPSKFTKEKTWPLLVVLDPAARGKVGLSSFLEVAENNGLIVACSNNAKNGSYVENIDIFSYTISHLLQVLPIDTEKMMLAGFSGGARSATALAVLSEGSIKGVIGSGAGFANEAKYQPNKRNLTYIGVVGEQDFNYYEMLGNRIYLNQKYIPNELILFEGDHRWPPAPVMTVAVELLLKKIVIDKLPEDDKQKRTLQFYQNHYRLAKDLEDSKKYHLAYDAYQQIVSNYKSHVDVDSIRQKLKEIRKNPAYKAFKRNELVQRPKEIELAAKYADFYFEDLEDNNLQNIEWWKKEFEKVEVFKNNPSPSVQLMGQRLYNLLQVIALESTKGLDPKLDVELLIFANEFLIALNPSYHNGYIELMRHYSTIGNYEFALGAMEELLKNGYTNEEALNKVEGIALLRIMPEYQALLEKY